MHVVPHYTVKALVAISYLPHMISFKTNLAENFKDIWLSIAACVRLFLNKWKCCFLQASAVGAVQVEQTFEKPVQPANYFYVGFPCF
jgi:hypothetical protein